MRIWWSLSACDLAEKFETFDDRSFGNLPKTRLKVMAVVLVAFRYECGTILIFAIEIGFLLLFIIAHSLAMIR